MSRRRGKHARWSAAREAVTNLWTWRAITIPLTLIMSILVGGYFTSTAGSVSASEQDAINKDLAGRYVITVGADGQPIESTICERMRNVDGVLTSFALADEYTPHRLGNKVRASVADVSPGFIDYVDAGMNLQGQKSSVLIGADIAERAGLVTGAHVRLEAENPIAANQESNTDHQVVVIDRTVRTGLSDDLIATVNADSFLARYCIVESRPGASADIATGIRALVPGGSASVNALDAALEDDRTPETSIRSAIGGPVVWMAGLLFSLIPLAFWYVRRAEWALFFAFGVNMRWHTIATVVEWLLLVALPVTLGVAWAIVLSPATTSWLGFKIALLNVGSILTLSLIVIPLWLAYLRFSSVLQSLKD